MGEYAAARSLTERALAINERCSARSIPNTQTVRRNLAALGVAAIVPY